MVSEISIKRVYEPASPSDGTRILVDRLWPRGLSKEKAHYDLWLKDVAPSTELREWFGHQPDRWPEFQKRYSAELSHNPAMAELRDLATKGHVTLLYGAHDEEHNQAVVLADVLKSRH
ncbi:DUF488 domain-containing protein [Paradevosia shaoguanensis]|uniref:DUF488 domain-containing protein n=1 Tax=Paradevosia shaoguanensis TaxID=1335043 RepID=UPI003C7383B5